MWLVTDIRKPGRSGGQLAVDFMSEVHHQYGLWTGGAVFLLHWYECPVCFSAFPLTMTLLI